MSGSLRIRRRIADNYAIVVAIVLVIGALGGYLTYATYIDPGTHTETREVSSWQSTGDFTHYATVVNGTAAFEEGSTLRNRSVYFIRTTPILDGAFEYTYTATEGGSLDVNVSASVVLRSRSEEERSTITYWRIERRLADTYVESLSPNERARVEFSLNVSKVAEEVRRIDDRLGGTPGQLEIEVVARIDATGTRNGHSVSVSRTYRLPISPDGGVYRVDDPGLVQASDTETVQVTVQNTYGPLRKVGGPVLVVLSLAGVLGFAYADRTGKLDVSDRERAWLTYQTQRDEFDEWISTATVPARDRQVKPVTLDSLSGLSNVAIDTDSRVIEDIETGAFFVFTDDKRFRYDPPPEPPDIDGNPLARRSDGQEVEHTEKNTTESTHDEREADPDNGNASADT